MDLNDQDEIYDTFEQYSHNYEIFEDIKGNVGDIYDSFPKDIIPDNNNDRFLIVTDCLRLKKYLTIFNDKKHCQDKNCCAYMNYMLNKMARIHKKSHESIFKFYISYINHDSNDMIKNLCQSKINHMNENKYQKINKLYTAYNLYKLFISNKYSTLSCTRANSCAKTYNNIINEHPKPDDAKFCKAVNEFKRILEENEYISRRKCNENIPDLLSYPDTCIHMQDKTDKIVTTPENRDSCLKTQKESAGSCVTHDQPRTVRTTDDHVISPESQGSTLPITLFSSGIGALLILLSSYKFTPLRHWFRLRTQRFKGISEHLNGEEYEMHQHNNEYDEKNEEYDGYNIPYGSS
ncbi:PIR Superfamily Protein [Plasmodium ovale curtisi]|uniref:PIR Superfamily Protein n=1 Tax=Plasmodium ovale curtisi TaxID=864141 RepID=A0A1A8WQY7_PLAOA|nr:PIR Superfamily Protein [Plasmodium ovale curtisi]